MCTPLGLSTKFIFKAIYSPDLACSRRLLVYTTGNFSSIGRKLSSLWGLKMYRDEQKKSEHLGPQSVSFIRFYCSLDPGNNYTNLLSQTPPRCHHLENQPTMLSVCKLSCQHNAQLKGAVHKQTVNMPVSVLEI